MSGSILGADGFRLLDFVSLHRSDIPELVRITRENMFEIILSAWGVEWRDETLLETLMDVNLNIEVVLEGKKVIGYYVLDQIEDYVFIVSIQLEKEHQGRGLGRSMMERVEEQAVRSGLEGVELCVQSTNQQAIGFYRHLGYRMASRRRNNLTMRKQFSLE
jgi:ribosomal protein S18 acetylase RimI-like enzyme